MGALSNTKINHKSHVSHRIDHPLNSLSDPTKGVLQRPETKGGDDSKEDAAARGPCQPVRKLVHVSGGHYRHRCLRAIDGRVQGLLESAVSVVVANTRIGFSGFGNPNYTCGGKKKGDMASVISHYQGLGAPPCCVCA